MTLGRNAESGPEKLEIGEIGLLEMSWTKTINSTNPTYPGL